MFPVYPFLALNAAVSSHIILTAAGHAGRNTVLGKIPAQIRLLGVVVIPFLLMTSLFLLRVVGVYTGYGAPLSLYEPLGAGITSGEVEVGIVGERGDFVCYGKEWYRFPTSYFLPRDMHAKFIRSEFNGLLPGEFQHRSDGFGLFPGTHLIPSGMNDLNQEDPGKYTNIKHCDFLVDTQYPVRAGKGVTLPPNEPDYVADTENWEVIKCLPFLDAENTGTIARMIWVPAWGIIPDKFQRKWGQHCLLRRRGTAEKAV